MNHTYSKTLFDTFPEIFDRKLLAGHIGCEDGWFELLGEFGLEAFRLSRTMPSADLRLRAIYVAGGMLRIRHRPEAPLAALVRQFQERSKSLCELDGLPAVGLFACRPHWRRYLCRRCAELHELMMVEESLPQHHGAGDTEGDPVPALSAAA